MDDSIIWMYNRNGRYSVKSRYYVARQVMRNGNWAECSRGNDEQKVWKALWKMKVPNKIKIFRWRACHGILPTRCNLAKRNIIAKLVARYACKVQRLRCTCYGTAQLPRMCGLEVEPSCKNAHLASKRCCSYLTI